MNLPEPLKSLEAEPRTTRCWANPANRLVSRWSDARTYTCGKPGTDRLDLCPSCVTELIEIPVLDGPRRVAVDA
jgi:hypothetical protein